VERYLTKYIEVPDLRFHLLSSPVTTQAIRPEFVTNAPTEGHDFYAFDEVSNMWINTKAGVATWNPSFESNFIVGKGYLVSYPQDETKVFAGNLNAADVTLSLTYTADMGNGWNLLGNPYPSAIDWDAINNEFNLGTGVDAALYYRDHNEQRYRYYIGLDGTSIGDGQQYIPAMQGFMVHAKSSGTRTVNLTNASRTHLGQTVFYKSASATQGSFSITAGNGAHSDKAFIHFHSGATEEFDGDFDAYKLRSYNALSPELYTRGSDNSELAINGLPGFSETVSIPVSFEYKSTGEHTFSADLSGISGMVVYLNDLKENTSANLTQNPVYTFIVSEGDPINRFSLTAGSLGVDEPGAQSSTLVYSNGNTIFVVGAAANSQITVYSVSGNMLTRMYTQDKGIEAIDATTFPKGVYVVAVQGEASRISRKVVL